MLFRQNHIFHGCYRVLWNLQQRKVQLSLLLQFLLFHYIFTAREEFIVLFNASQNISTSCFFLFEAKNGGNIHMLYFPLVCYAFFFKYLVRLWSFYLFFSGKQRNILLVHYCFYKIIFSVVFIETLNCFFFSSVFESGQRFWIAWCYLQLSLHSSFRSIIEYTLWRLHNVIEFQTDTISFLAGKQYKYGASV